MPLTLAVLPLSLYFSLLVCIIRLGVGRHYPLDLLLRFILIPIVSVIFDSIWQKHVPNYVTKAENSLITLYSSSRVSARN